VSALLAFEGLSKDWFGVPAVSDLTLDVPQGSTLGLIGENGAGKSTLMNMVGGVVSPSRGRMLWRGEPYAPRSAADATVRGIAFIHQELNLFTNLSIAENIFIDGFPRRFGLIDRRRIAETTRALLARLLLDHGPEKVVGELAPGERQLVEIAKALHREADLIIFDEPTTSLTPRETARLFDVIARLKAEGRTVIYVSHILGDVQRLCDRIAVLRDGRLVDHGPSREFDVGRMIRSMIGRELSGMFPPRSASPRAEVVFEARGLSQPGIVEGVSFEIRAGEVLGLFGLMGSGRSELARIVFGLDPVERGELRLGGRALEGGPGARIAAGVAFVTENRREEGLMMEAPVADNLSLVAVRAFGRGPLALIDREAHAEATDAGAGRAGRAGGRHRAPAGQGALGRQPAEGGDRQVADERAAALHPRRADPRRGRGREVRDLRARGPAGGDGGGDPVHLVGARRADRHVRPHSGDEPRRGHGGFRGAAVRAGAHFGRGLSGGRGVSSRGLGERTLDLTLRHATVLIFACVLLYFGLQAPGFLAPESLGNIVKQSAFIGIAAIGITFVLLTAGIDLSVGSVMYLAPLVAGFAMRDHGVGVTGGLFVAVAAGAALGATNAFFIVRLNIVPFIVTLATLFAFRGFGAFLTSSRSSTFPRRSGTSASPPWRGSRSRSCSSAPSRCWRM
jgi:ribose transport system ATP-binding protein